LFRVASGYGPGSLARRARGPAALAFTYVRRNPPTNEEPPMKCPVDDTTLAISDRQGIEIDYCPECRGVWLDRGELDKLIERESTWVDQQVDERSRSKGKEPKAEQPKKKKKVSSFLQDLMEMGQG
jgi:Zn-finger nucleic acid-binding protein